MLKPVRIADTASANRLIKLWAARYLPDLSILPARKGEFPVEALVRSASLAGRTQTVERTKRLLRLNCEIAGLETKSLFAYIPNIVNLAEARHLAHQVEQVYEAVLDIYLQQPPPSHYLQFIDASSNLFSKLALPSLLLPTITNLAETLELILLEMQEQHLRARDRRTIGFITTQFHFSTREVLKQLTPCEQVLLTPYLKFVEEQVCIPWQRLCAAALDVVPGSPPFLLVEHMLPLSQKIAETVYEQALTTHHDATSRRGALGEPDIAASTIRDLNMFQGYLWLCVLENRMAAIEKELLPLCQVVFPSIGVSWELVESVLQLLVDEIQAHLKPDERTLLLPYTRAMQSIFAQTPDTKRQAQIPLEA